MASANSIADLATRHARAMVSVRQKPAPTKERLAAVDALRGLAALAVVLAFMLGSFVARNSDLWVHLAAGKRLLSGDYRPGTDPFSYSAGERPWVNHSLLFDVGAYLLYKGDGALLGVVKALTVALAFGLVIGIRRPRYALWPWAAVAIVAVGGYHVYKGASRSFLDDLQGTPSDLVRRLGLIGYIAKGLVIAGAGVLVIVAASLSQPDKATGLDGALKTLGAQPYGAILLSLAGLGVITYGLYSFAMARYTKM